MVTHRSDERTVIPRNSAGQNIRTLVWLLLGLIVSFYGRTALAESARGINIGLHSPQKVDAQNTISLDIPLDALEQDNARRLAVAEASGFNVVRLRFHIALIRQSMPQSERAIVLRLVSDFVNKANAHGVKVFVALMSENGHDTKDLVCNQHDDLAQAVTAVVNALPDTPMAGIEPLNEPANGCGPANGDKRWENFQQSLYRQIRALKPHLTIVASGGAWGTLDGLLTLDPSPYRADNYVIFSYHYYEPFLFTHQGVPWLNSGLMVKRWAETRPTVLDRPGQPRRHDDVALPDVWLAS